MNNSHVCRLNSPLWNSLWLAIFFIRSKRKHFLINMLNMCRRWKDLRTHLCCDLWFIVSCCCFLSTLIVLLHFWTLYCAIYAEKEMNCCNSHMFSACWVVDDEKERWEVS